MNRRHFLTLPLATAAATPRRPLRILLRSSWQSVNIGDIGHTPGAIDILKRHIPDARITLWPGELEHGAREMLTAAYPDLTIAEGSVQSGKPASPALAKAWEEADLYLSGSGSGFPAADHAAAFRKMTGKPVGVFGVSLDPISGIGEGRDPEGGTLAKLRDQALRLPAAHLSSALRETIDHCAFFFCRDTITRDYLRAQGVKTPILEFGPDAQLGMELRADSKADSFLASSGLSGGKFICVIPRLRYTPYYQIRKTPRVSSDDVKDAINNRSVESDLAKLREMMVVYVQKTGGKVLTCPEMTYQIELARKYLIDPLPEPIRKNVVWMDRFWLPDEAASVYAKTSAVVSMDCHSPLIAFKSRTPAIYLRQPTDTCKGEMYRDLGVPEWCMEIDQTSAAQLWSSVEAIVRSPDKAKKKVDSVMARAGSLQKRMADVVRAVPL